MIRQAVEDIASAKKNKSNPVIIAPIILVATNSIANRIIENKIVPRTPTRLKERLEQTQPTSALSPKEEAVTRVTARYTTAMPKTTHKNAGVTVITAVILRKAVIIPIIKLETRAIPAQLLLQPQLQFIIDINIFTSTSFYDIN